MKDVTNLLRRLLARLISPPEGRLLSRPLGRAADQNVDAALSGLGMTRSDLFTPGTTLAPHRERIARMIPMQGLDPESLVTDSWETLKEADHRCAYCENVRRCERWLDWGRSNDAPRMFCPNGTTFEALRRRVLN